MRSISESVPVLSQNVPKISLLLVIMSPVSLWTILYKSKLWYGLFSSLKCNCILRSFCCMPSSIRFEEKSFVIALKIVSASSRLLLFLIFFIAVIIWLLKLSITNKNKLILPPAAYTSPPFTNPQQKTKNGRTVREKQKIKHRQKEKREEKKGNQRNKETQRKAKIGERPKKK